MPSPNNAVIRHLDSVVDDFCRRTRFFKEPMTKGRARMFVLQHRLNTRQRNSVLKLKVATNCPDWDMRLRIIGACSEEIIADHEHGHGKPHWQILEELGTFIGMKRADIRAAKPIATTQIACMNPIQFEISAAGQRHHARRGKPRAVTKRIGKPAAGTAWASSPRLLPTNTTAAPGWLRRSSSATAIPGNT